ncbi:MAG: hypothetical protein DME32_03445 [Verrucomicrobia bacterium]|nr:MAG: hypothetical protein DME32_03445 [Verrucomicrobiota bacterium]
MTFETALRQVKEIETSTTSAVKDYALTGRSDFSAKGRLPPEANKSPGLVRRDAIAMKRIDDKLH